MALNFLNNGYFAGSVGIGTESPLDKLDVSNGNIRISQTGDVAAQLILNTYQSALGNATYKWFVEQTTSANSYSFQIGNGTTPYLHINSLLFGAAAGNVGIGTTSPDHKLRVNGDARIGNLHIKTADFGSGGTGKTIYADGAGSGVLGFTSTTAFDFSNGTTSRMRIDSAGNVGIGTTSPLASLDVASTTNDYVAKFSHSTATGYAPGSILLQAGQGNSRGQGIYHYNTEADENWFTGVPYNVQSKKWIVANKYSTIQDVDTAQLIHALMTIDSDTGNVGIGTTSPTQLLHVSSITSNPTGIGLQNSQRYYSVRSNNYSLVFTDETVGSERMRIDNNGNVGIGTTSPDAPLVVYRTGDVWHSVIGNATGQVRIGGQAASGGVIQSRSQSGTARDLYLQRDGGFVGIGTNAPSQRLHVSGNARVTGAYYDSNDSPGTANQVLISTVTGTDWVDGSAIPGVPAGSGTLNTVAMWTPNGDTLGNSPITISGNNSTFAGDVKWSGGVGRLVSNQLQSGYNQNADNTDFWINYTGYQGGSTYFRDFRIGDGKQNQIAFFDGSTKNATFAGDVLINQTANLTNRPLQVNGFIDITDITGTALRWYNGTTFTGGLGTMDWALSGQNASDIGMYIAGNNSFFVLTNNVSRLEINSTGATFAGTIAVQGTGDSYFTGNVGIGTTSPGTFLQIGTYAVAGKYINQAAYPNIPSEHMMHITAPSTTGYYGGGISFGETAFTAANITVKDAGGLGALDLCFGTGNTYGVTEKMRIANNGNVGIGTDDPGDYRLAVENTSEDLLKLHNSTDGLDALISFTNPGGTLGRIQGIDNGGLGFDTGNNAGGINSNAMFIDNSGNVGIGMTSPSAFNQRVNAPHLVVGAGNNSAGLTLYSGIASQGSINFADGTTTSDQYTGGILYVHGSDNYMTFYTNGGGEKMRIGSDGAIKFNTYNLTNQTGTPTYLLGTDASGNVVKTLSSTAPGSLWLASGNNIYNTNSANVGIGLSGPETDLMIYDTVSEDPAEPGNATTGMFALNRSGQATLSVGVNSSNVYWISNVNRAFTGPNYYNISLNPLGGKVGIGTTSPGANLDVAGTAPVIRITNTTDPLGNGTVGSFEFFTKDSSTGATRTVSSIVCDNNAGSSVPEGELVFKTSLGGGGSPIATEKMRINATGAIKFNAYDSTNNTGTPTYLLGTDGSGNIVKTNTVPGSGAGPYLPLSAGASYPLTGNLYLESSNTDVVMSGNTSGNFTIDNNTGNIAFNANGSSVQSMNITSSLITINEPTNFTNGNVGIGTTSPDGKLDISESSGPTSLYMNNLDTAQTDTGDVQNQIIMKGLYWSGSGTSQLIETRINSVHQLPNGNGGSALTFMTQTGGSGVVEQMRIDRDGNVGIGVTGPTDKLTVNGNLSIFGNKIYNGSASNSAGVSFPSSTTRIDGYNGITFHSSQTTVGSQTERMRVTNAGNVGIGITLPAAKLEINAASGGIGGYTSFKTKYGTSSVQSLSMGQVTAGNGAWIGTAQYRNAGYWQTEGTAASVISLDSGGNIAFSTNTGLTANTDYNITERMRIDTAGAIRFNSYGAGTLVTDASGNITVSSGGGAGGPYLPLAGGTMTGVTQFNDHTQHGDQVSAKWGAGNDLTIKHNATDSFIENYTGHLSIVNYANDKDITLWNDDGTGGIAKYLVLDGNTTHAYFSNPGNVGIGTTSPGARLDVVGNGNAVLIRRSNGFASIKASSDNGGNLILDSFSTAGAVFINHYANRPVYIATGGGNVGIGTTSPGAKLEVAGGSTGIRLSNVGNSGAYDSVEMTYNGYNSGTPEMKFRPTQTPGSGIVNSYFRFINSNGSSTTANNNANVTIDGSVGIGTTSPTYQLDVVSAGNALLSLTGVDKPIMRFMVGTSTVGTIQAQTNTSLNVSAYGTSSLNLQTAGTAPRLTILTGGNVGIGTTSPGNKLEVNGVGSFTGGAVAGVNDSHNAGIYLNTTGRGLSGNFQGYARNLINTDGSVIEIGQGTSLISQIKLNAGSSSVNGVINLMTKGSVRMRIDSAGNVGIGTTSPGAKLHVHSTSGDGKLRVSGDNIENSGGELKGFNNGFAFNVAPSGGGTYVERMRINGSGNVGIGTSAPATQLEIFKINDDPATLRLSSEITDADLVGAIISFSNDAGGGGVQGRIESVSTDDDSTIFKFYTDNTSSPSMTLFDSGNMTIAGTLTQNSDVRLKENIKPIESALDKVKQMQGVEFNKINSSTKEIGVVAQEIEKIIPELVLEDKEGIKSVAYGNITAVLIEAIKEQQKQIEELKQQLNK